jgi:hypothetical protein
MNRTDAVAWVVCVCASYLRLSQAKTLGALVDGAMRCQRASLASIGRQMLGTAKHQIKRCWRFCANERIETADAMHGILKRVLQKRRKPLIVSLDWTDIRQFSMLMACVVLKSGRSVPICWASCTKNVFEGHKSRNAFEESLLLVLRSMIPPGQQVVLLADRGFGRTELARFCQRYGLDYVIRIKPDVWIRSAGYEGKLLDYPVRKGVCRLLRGVGYRQKDPVQLNVVVRWVRGLPARRDECWFLMSSVAGSPGKISRMYGKRMGIEQLFRDAKNKRNGWSLRDTQISLPERLDRLMLILAVAYLLLCGVGLVALTKGQHRHWSSSSKGQMHSLFAIGQVMLQRTGGLTPAVAFRTLLADTELLL